MPWNFCSDSGMNRICGPLFEGGERDVEFRFTVRLQLPQLKRSWQLWRRGYEDQCCWCRDRWHHRRDPRRAARGGVGRSSRCRCRSRDCKESRPLPPEEMRLRRLILEIVVVPTMTTYGAESIPAAIASSGAQLLANRVLSCECCPCPKSHPTRFFDTTLRQGLPFLHFSWFDNFIRRWK